MTDTRTDEEVICGWMGWSPFTTTVQGRRKPMELDLDSLREVEERLTGEQWARYEETLGDTIPRTHVRIGI